MADTSRKVGDLPKLGRIAEIAIDLVLRARARMPEGKVSRPEDSRGGDDQGSASGEKFWILRNASNTLHGRGRCSKLLRNCQIGTLGQFDDGCTSHLAALSAALELGDVDLKRPCFTDGWCPCFVEARVFQTPGVAPSWTVQHWSFVICAVLPRRHCLKAP